MRAQPGANPVESKGIQIQRLETMAHLKGCEELQRSIWGFPDVEIVPAFLLKVAQDHGGLVLGALDGKSLVGLAFSLVGLQDGRLHHHSDMVGVLPGYQNRGIGFQLKVRQRAEVLAQGMGLITWTVDPLEAVNVNLHFRRLGARARAYVRDYYGKMEDDRNRGLPSDRLLVEWELKDSRVEARVGGFEVNPGEIKGEAVVKSEPQSGGLRRPLGWEKDLRGQTLLVEVPWSLHDAKGAEPAVALAWRTTTRAALEHYLGRGWVVEDFVSDRRYRRGYLFLRRGGRR